MSYYSKRAADGLKFIDVLRAVWGISDEGPRREYVEPGSFSSDIYSLSSKQDAGRGARRRTEWPY